VSDQVSHPYKTTGQIIILYIFNLYIFGKQIRRQRILDRNVLCIPLF